MEKEVWVYPSAHGTSGIEIPFFRCEDGAYRLDPACPPPDPRGTSAEWYRANAARWAGFGAPTLTRSQAEDLIASIVGSGSAAESPARRSRSTAGEGRGAEAADAASPAPFSDAAYFFRAQDGSVLTLLAVELPEGPGTDAAREGGILAAVTLEDRGAGGTRTMLLDRAPPGDGARVFSGRTYLPPRSSHAARFAIKDEAKEEILVRNRRLDVPDLSGFAASSVVPAERFGPAGTEGRWVVGSEEVVPRPAAAFRRGELLRLYLQVYGAAPDPATSMARVDVSFRFTCDAKSRPRAIREPYKVTGAAGASMGLALPIGDWPEGAYRVHVDLHDRVSGRRASVAGAFRIAGR